MKVEGWGRYPVADAEVHYPSSVEDIQRLLASRPAIPRGLGRSYGDSSLGMHMLDSRRLNHLLSFDETEGVLYAEAGVALADILEVFVPKGWFLPVTPGTRFITLGGAIASDVHGKNHHISGCFSDHVLFLDICLGDGQLLRCSPSLHPELFGATCGGMGLTGMIVAAALRLKRITGAMIDQETFKAANLAESLALFDSHAHTPYSVAWIDCLSKGKALGRSLLMAGDHAAEGELACGKVSRLNFPVDLPGALLNRYTIKAFNQLYYHRVKGRSIKNRVHYEPFFYPLDSIAGWNRMYGRNGFTQYQFVLPKAAGHQAMADILKTIASSGKGSFLAVLKAFGKANANLLSFPMEGYTLALDFKVDRSLFPLLDRLDAMVIDYGGRLYLTKDARMGCETFRKGYPAWERFCQICSKHGGNGVFQSLQSQRLGLHA